MSRKGFKELKRKLKRISEEISATFEITRFTSFQDGISSFMGKIEVQKMCRNGFQEPPHVKQHLMHKHEATMRYLENKYSSYWHNYKVPLLETREDEYKNKIWVCWWQGYDNAPEIVKKCIESIRNHSGKYEVIIVTDENVDKFVTFPSHIKEKVKAGIISRTIYSDLLRISLLSEHGGIWLDSTFFCIGDLSDYVESPIWSIKRPDYLHASIAGGGFSNYSLGCNYENRLIFRVFRDFLFYYWQHNNKLIDYLLTDYVIVMCENHIPELKSVMDSISPNNKNCDELWKILDKPYEESLWNKIKADTILYKLSWKSEYPEKTGGKTTFYGMLMDSLLN